MVGALGLFCGDHDLAEDLAQDAVVELCRRWDAVREMRRPDRWLFTVAFNRARSHHRRNAVGRAARRLLTSSNSQVCPAPDRSDSVDPQRALQRLAPIDRRIVIMRHHLGFASVEIADELGIAPGTVRSRLSRATARLRPRLVETRSDVPVNGDRQATSTPPQLGGSTTANSASEPAAGITGRKALEDEGADR
ncbi:RNA polymerase sigma factor [Euzebya tangerina]|uniref:RNA polymerase sigma factor n=1 Tax=Euzebya tangerina TaxID=591198 RepID=UPI0039C8B54A